MGTPVAIKISADLADTARAAAAAADRSLTGQVEHWAKLGRAIESVLPATAANALKQVGSKLEAIEDPTLRNEVVAALDDFRDSSASNKRARLGLDQQTHYEPDPSRSKGLIRVEPDGTRTRGTRQGKTFMPFTD